jgi:hypothetical protein
MELPSSFTLESTTWVSSVPQNGHLTWDMKIYI